MCAAGAGRVRDVFGAGSGLFCVSWWVHWFCKGFDVVVLGEALAGS